METWGKKACITNDSLDFMYIELAEMQKNIEESSYNLNVQREKIGKIFKDIRKVLNIKYA